jgi:hypothetical protein
MLPSIMHDQLSRLSIALLRGVGPNASCRGCSSEQLYGIFPATETINVIPGIAGPADAHYGCIMAHTSFYGMTCMISCVLACCSSDSTDICL